MRRLTLAAVGMLLLFSSATAVAQTAPPAPTPPTEATPPPAETPPIDATPGVEEQQTEAPGLRVENGDDDDDDGLSPTALTIIIVAAVLVLLLIFAMFWAPWRRPGEPGPP